MRANVESALCDEPVLYGTMDFSHQSNRRRDSFRRRLTDVGTRLTITIAVRAISFAFHASEFLSTFSIVGTLWLGRSGAPYS